MAVDTNAGGDAGGESLHDMLNAAYDEQEAAISTPDQTAPDTGTEAPVETTTEAPEAPRSDDGRPRAPDGKFVKKADGAPAPAAAAPVDPKAAKTAATAPVPQAPVQEPPQHWAPQLREAYKKLPPEAQGPLANAIKGVEADYTRRVQAMQPYQDLAQTAQQWGPYFAQLGITPAQSFTNLLRAEYMLRNGLPSEKVSSFRNLAQAYGVDLSKLVENPQQQEYVDPQVQTLQQRIEEMHRQQQTLTQQMQQAQQIEQRRQQEMAQQPYISMVEQFASEKDENGTPRHPYFEQVADAMRGLLAVAREAGRNPTLGELYQQAVWSNPQTRAQMIASQAEAAKRKAEAEAKARAAVTRRATASVTGSPSGASMPAPASTIRGELERLMGV